LILLDTHVVIWWATGALERLSKEARVALEGQEDAAAGGGRLVSAISCWEVAMLTQRGRLALNMEWDHWLALVKEREQKSPGGTRAARDRWRGRLKC
jgi:PIN domain nuclease of toxin-antitoxin system